MSKGLSEREVSAQVVAFMQAEGWTAKRNQVGTFAKGGGSKSYFRFGKPGEADYTFVRYLRTRYPGQAAVCHIEMKREKGGVISPDQIAWRREQEAMGAVVLMASDFDSFRADYYRMFGWLQKFTGEVA